MLTTTRRIGTASSRAAIAGRRSRSRALCSTISNSTANACVPAVQRGLVGVASASHPAVQSSANSDVKGPSYVRSLSTRSWDGDSLGRRPDPNPNLLSSSALGGRHVPTLMGRPAAVASAASTRNPFRATVRPISFLSDPLSVSTCNDGASPASSTHMIRLPLSGSLNFVTGSTSNTCCGSSSAAGSSTVVQRRTVHTSSTRSIIKSNMINSNKRSIGAYSDCMSSLQLMTPFEQNLLQNFVLRALFSTQPQPSSESSSNDNLSNNATPSSDASSFAKSASASKQSTTSTVSADPSVVTSATTESSPSSSKSKSKSPPKELAVHHSTATDAFISFLKSLPKTTYDLLLTAVQSLTSLLAKTPGVLWYYLTHPAKFRDKLLELKEAAKKEAHHYYMGSKLLAADLRTARQMLGRSLQGTPLTRRERKQLLRTVSDVFRLVPMSIFVLIPFMEFALPFALKIFPNMLPSTFQDSLKAEENMKRELKMRLTMAEFFQETLQDLAQDQKKRASIKGQSKDQESTASGSANSNGGEDSHHAKKKKTAQSFLAFLEKARNGDMLPAEEIIKYASYFQDELTLDNMPRMQLVNFCRYMSIPPYGSDNVLRFQLRHRMRMLQEDDQRILWEGIDSLTKMELREACQERGMRSTGLSKDAYKRALQQWLDLSVNRNVPISLLIMSRTFFLRDEMTRSAVETDTDESQSVAGLADAISGLDKDVVNEVVLSVASSEEKSDPEVVKIKLEVLEHQNELIEEEKKEREEIAAKKAAKEQEKAKTEEEKIKAQEESAESISDGKTGENFEVPVDKIEVSTPTGKVEITEPIKVELELGSEQDSRSCEDDTAKAEAAKEDVEETSAEEEEDEKGLSTDEIDAISQLVSPSPVSSEREELERIKAAMLDDDEDDAPTEAAASKLSEAVESLEKIDEKVSDVDTWAESLGPETASRESGWSASEIDAKAAEAIDRVDEAVEAEAAASTSFSTGDEEQAKEEKTEEDGESEEEESSSGDEKLDKAVDRLKYRVESMVGRLEAQLSDVEAKIGDKLHLLDRDLDETISTEEMSVVLQQVLKRKLSAEEARAIAADMDANKDGFLTVVELSKWVEENRIIKLVEEGRDGEVDRMIDRRREKLLKEQEQLNESSDGADNI